MLDAGDLLRRLVAFSGDNHDVACGGVRQRIADRLRTVGFNGERCRTGDGRWLDPGHNRLDDLHRILAARIVARHDQPVGELRARLAHQRTLHRVAVPACAEDDPEGGRRCLGCLGFGMFGFSCPSGIQFVAHRRQDLLEAVGRVGEIDVDLGFHRGILHALEPSPPRHQLRDRRLDDVVRNPRRLGERRRDEDVRLVVVADERQVREVVPRRLVAHRQDVERIPADRLEHLASVPAVQADDVRREIPPPAVRPRRRRLVRDLLREGRLDAEVLLHRPVVVEMVLREVRERAARKDRVTRPPLVDRMARHLHHAVGESVRLHPREDLLQLLERRRRIARRVPILPVKDLDGRQVPALPPRTGVHEFGEDPRAGGLTIRPCDSPEIHAFNLLHRTRC